MSGDSIRTIKKRAWNILLLISYMYVREISKKKKKSPFLWTLFHSADSGLAIYILLKTNKQLVLECLFLDII